MKTKLYNIYWYKKSQEWVMSKKYEIRESDILYRHPNLAWILTRVFEELFSERKAKRLGSKFWKRTLCKSSRRIHRSKVLCRFLRTTNDYN